LDFLLTGLLKPRRAVDVNREAELTALPALARPIWSGGAGDQTL